MSILLTALSSAASSSHIAGGVHGDHCSVFTKPRSLLSHQGFYLNPSRNVPPKQILLQVFYIMEDKNVISL